MRPPDFLPSRRDHHRVVRGLASLAASLALANAALWWPTVSPGPSEGRLPAPTPAEALVLEPIPATDQAAPPSLPPALAPPPDAAPVAVADEAIVREVAPRLPPSLALDDRPLAAGSAGPSGPSGPPAPPPPAPPPPLDPPRAAAASRVVEQPTRSPRQTGFPLPVYPEAARREGMRARVRVRVLVAETGGVLEAAVAERFVLDRRDRATPVPALPYGMDDAALAAARSVRFTPALDGAERVRAYAFVTLAFDPPRGG